MSRHLLLISLLASISASAQEFDAHGFSMAPADGDVRDVLSVERAGTLTAGDFYATGLLEFAKSPLVMVELTNGDAQETVMIDNLTALNISAGYTVHERVRLDLRMPLYITSFGPEGYQGVDTGVLRLSSLMLALAPGGDGGLGLGVVPWVDLPTGTEPLLNNAKIAGGAKVAATYEAETLTLSGNLGVQFNPDAGLENLQGAEQLVAGLGASYLLTEKLSVGAELVMLAALSKGDHPGTNTPAEVLLSARGRQESGLHWVGGAGLGISPGAGAARFRLFAGLGFGKIAPVINPNTIDTDGDGVPDIHDLCPDELETMNGFEDTDGCPDLAPANLTIQIRFEGQPLGGADVTVENPEGVELYEFAETSIELSDVPRESDWLVTGVKGACLGGGTEGLVGTSGEHEIVLNLQRIVAGKADIDVRDENGDPIPGAIVRWLSESPECVPGRTELAASGQMVQELGAGKHTMVVEAPNFAGFMQDIEIEQGGDPTAPPITVNATLEPSKIRMEAEKIVILDRIYFETDNTRIQQRSQALLDQIAITLRSNPQIKLVEVSGHTDSQGNPDYNMQLSKQRAESVVKYLTDKGVEAERLQAKGMGPSAPIDDNNTATGRANNRRVEFKITRQDKTAPAE